MGKTSADEARAFPVTIKQCLIRLNHLLLQRQRDDGSAYQIIGFPILDFLIPTDSN